jgi:hypothetical protein
MFKSAKIFVTGILLTALIPVSAMALYDPNNTAQPAEGEMRIMAVTEPAASGGPAVNPTEIAPAPAAEPDAKPIDGAGVSGMGGASTGGSVGVSIGASGTGSASAGTVAVPPDTAAGSSDIPEATIKRQQEIDTILFKTNAEKLGEMGIKVTHTVPNGDIVEIGITPYSEENAKVIYDMAGAEGIKVVEGLSAEIYTATAVDGTAVAGGTQASVAPEDAGEIATTSVQGADGVIAAPNADKAADAVLYTAAEAQRESKAPDMLIYVLGAAAAVVIGIAILVLRKVKVLKTAK